MKIVVISFKITTNIPEEVESSTICYLLGFDWVLLQTPAQVLSQNPCRYVFLLLHGHMGETHMLGSS